MISPKSSRLIALEVLYQLQLGPTPLPVLLEDLTRHQILKANDRNLAMNLIYGVLRQRQYLDLLISRLCRQPVKKIHPLVYPALALGLYQLFFLSRIPESAAVNETVNALKNTSAPKRLHGFVNGVLRQSIRQRASFPQPDQAMDADGQPVLNHPQWLTQRWENHFGREEMVAICRENNSRPPLTLRVNSVKIRRSDFAALLAAEGIAAIPGNYCGDALLLTEYHGPVSSIPGYEDGLFQVQDEAAQLAGLLLQPLKENGLYLDCCAGLGGKTSHILQLADGSMAQLTAVEPESHRQERLVENLHRLSPSQKYSLFRGSLQQFCQTSAYCFHGVLVDAPCSGTGVTGRHPDIRWRRTLTDILHYATIQQELLQLASSQVLPGGILVYATCSLEPEENQDTITQFLSRNPDFSLTDCAPFLPPSAHPLVKNFFFQPHPAHGLDGFFAARLLRQPTI